jgi:hypothetical protein
MNEPSLSNKHRLIHITNLKPDSCRLRRTMPLRRALLLASARSHGRYDSHLVRSTQACHLSAGIARNPNTSIIVPRPTRPEVLDNLKAPGPIILRQTTNKHYSEHWIRCEGYALKSLSFHVV